MLLWNVDFHFRHSLSAGGREPPRRACGVSHVALFPQESRAFRSNQLCFYLDRTLLSTKCVCKMGTLISTSGTHFPRAVREPPWRFALVGSPQDSLFPQESHAFRSNQLCFYLDRTLLSTKCVCKMGTLISLQVLAFRGRAGASVRLRSLPCRAFPVGVSCLPFQSTLCY